MVVATKLNLWFKFKLIFLGSRVSPLEPPKYLEEKRLIEDSKGSYLGIMDEIMELNLKVFSRFDSKFICELLASMEGSDVQRCFCEYLFPFPTFLENSSDNDDSLFEGCTCGEPE